MKFVVMSFDKETGLAEHAASEEVLIFVLYSQEITGYRVKSMLSRKAKTLNLLRNRTGRKILKKIYQNA